MGSGPNKEEVVQLVVPISLRGRLVTAKHEGCNGHRGDTLDRLKRKYFWPSMTSDVKAWIDACACQRKKREHPNQRVGNIQSLEIVAPGEWITFDFFGPLPESLNGNKYLLVMADRGSRELMLEALPDRKAVGVAEKLYRRIFLRGVSPRILQSDLAKEFVSDVLKELSSKLGSKLKHSSPYHPQTNTSVERYNKTIATSLSLLIQRADQKDWDQHLGEVEYSQLCAAQPGLGKLSPLFLSRGIDPIEPIDRAAEPKSNDPQMRSVENWLLNLQRAREIAYTSQKLANATEALRLAKIVKTNDISIDDEVWIYFPNVPKGLSKKLAFRMHGPYLVKEWLHDNNRVAVLEHKEVKNDRILAHVDRMVKRRDVPDNLIKQWKPLELRRLSFDEATRDELAAARKESDAAAKVAAQPAAAPSNNVHQASPEAMGKSTARKGRKKQRSSRRRSGRVL
jgi:transposase InsO family protein